ncbi:hypothetical protein [Streptomyces sp. NPDC057740]|uniref:hypothetical protein n=1 Tax=Streptomyces sp. NPDC057740 TaxID=3346234 RepID=UPI0036B4C614
MAKPNTTRLDREIRLAERKIKAVQNEEWWPLTGAERRKVRGALVGGSYRVLRGKSTGRAERALEQAWNAVNTRLSSELTALKKERQRIVDEAATAKAAKKSSSWW